MTITTISTVTSPGAALPAGSRLYRHVVPLARPMNPATAAAALRTDGRVMLTAGSDGSRATLAVGELAVLSHPGGAGHAPLADAVEFLAGLDIPADTPDSEVAWYGLLGYDAARDFERLPSRHPATDRPVYEFFLPEVLVQFTDGHGQVIGRGSSAAAARAAAERVARRLGRHAVAPFGGIAVGTGVFGFSFEEYAAAVDRAKGHILDGDVFQLVLSNAWSAPATVDGLAVFERLTAINPSPYHFWYGGPRFEVVGASPEPCLTLNDGRALIRPLAGTRPRGHDSVADLRAEADLRASVKELAEHRMLVDLARNDLGRVCRPGSVSVERLMDVERYSHVMHLTSDVGGHIRDDRRTDELIRATFPAGTMTGTPKVRAMQIIDDLEPSPRWLYSGAVGSFGLSHVDLFLTIRSMVLCDGEIRLQAGGGIVHDSEASAEHAECLAKLGSGARALGVTMKGGAK
ncbi:anthranilate/para-aminobenzoate synthase component I [Mycolicibacterium rhodesiae NBB3]|uniref:Anthranilate/para-aminobenzoate synthase component I n=1 Tax=Mycolicibacterium rhodesiae (strain NBB3) TaxID=710685 RepID=G8RVA1_MYCRN|nr:anthranilate synthase component I family protein [Mycolicibacterium rhodesiae]AEV72973.1 anthranilate/para-aminobenzoate synthase component I [Mycolicibacterium rhodesiae NBB3]